MLKDLEVRKTAWWTKVSAGKMNSENSSTVRLSGAGNWKLWKFQIRIILRSKGISKIVDGSEGKPVQGTDETSVVFAKRLNEWIGKDVRAQETLVTRMEEAPMRHLTTCETASEMWRKLAAIYEQESNISVHLIQQRFFQLKYEGEGIAIFVSKVEEIANQLKQVNVDISEGMQITKILMSLPDEFKHFISAWESVSQERQSINELISRLLIEEERINGKENQEKDNYAMAAKYVERRKCYTCGKTGHLKKECYRNKEVKDTSGLYATIVRSQGI